MKSGIFFGKVQVQRYSIKINRKNHFESLKNIFDAVERVNERFYLIVDEYDSFALAIDMTLPDLGQAQYQSTPIELNPQYRHVRESEERLQPTIRSK